MSSNLDNFLKGKFRLNLQNAVPEAYGNMVCVVLAFSGLTICKSMLVLVTEIPLTKAECN